MFIFEYDCRGCKQSFLYPISFNYDIPEPHSSGCPRCGSADVIQLTPQEESIHIHTVSSGDLIPTPKSP